MLIGSRREERLVRFGLVSLFYRVVTKRHNVLKVVTDNRLARFLDGTPCPEPYRDSGIAAGSRNSYTLSPGLSVCWGDSSGNDALEV